MFEKEAEEYMKDKFRTTSVTGYNSMKLAYQKGAEFGYNKAKEEMQVQIEKMECCENCKRYKPCVTCNETIGNDCDYYSGGNVCDSWQLN